MEPPEISCPTLPLLLLSTVDHLEIGLKVALNRALARYLASFQ